MGLRRGKAGGRKGAALAMALLLAASTLAGSLTLPAQAAAPGAPVVTAQETAGEATPEQANEAAPEQEAETAGKVTPEQADEQVPDETAGQEQMPAEDGKDKDASQPPKQENAGEASGSAESGETDGQPEENTGADASTENGGQSSSSSALASTDGTAAGGQSTGSADGATTGQTGESADGATTGQTGEDADGATTGLTGEDADGAATGRTGESADGAATGLTSEAAEGATTGLTAEAAEGATTGLTAQVMRARAAQEAGIVDFDSFQMAIANAPEGEETVLTLEGDIALEETIEIQDGQQIVLVDDGTPRTISAGKEIGGAFCIYKGGSLTIRTSTKGDDSLLSFDGAGLGAGAENHKGRAATVYGQLYLEGGTIRNVRGGANNAGVIRLEEGALFEMTGGRITDCANRGQRYSGMVYVECGSTFRMSGGEISGNADEDNDLTNMTAAVYVSNLKHGEATFEMMGGRIANNRFPMGTVIVGEALPEELSMDKERPVSVMRMSGGKITGNESLTYGGGVFVAAAGRLEMSGGEISGNKAATAGGGVMVSTQWDSRKTSLAEWEAKFPAEFIMTGGTISGNSATNGGGIGIASNRVQLKAGTISGNSAKEGGGLHVREGYGTHTMNAVISENTASVHGGGMWVGSTSDARAYRREGAAFFDNSAKSAGDDVAALASANQEVLGLSNFMTGGWLTHWYKDGAMNDSSVQRFPNSDDEYMKDCGVIYSVGESHALKSVPNNEVTDEAREAARAAGKVFITGNTAERGGGIGVNGGIILGRKAAEPENEEYERPYEETGRTDIIVEKEWAEPDEPHQSVIFCGQFNTCLSVSLPAPAFRFRSLNLSYPFPALWAIL